MDKKTLIRSLRIQGFSYKIVKAFEEVDRDLFIPEALRHYSYENTALPTVGGSTISQPYTIAFMLTLLELNSRQKILEIGSGSGYVLALMNKISKSSEIFGVEVIKELVESSRKILSRHKNIKIFEKENSLGLQSKAPFDRILASASAEKFPKKLLEQLNEKGILVCPVRNSIVKIRKLNDEFVKEEFPGFIFVPLVEG